MCFVDIEKIQTDFYERWKHLSEIRNVESSPKLDSIKPIYPSIFHYSTTLPFGKRDLRKCFISNAFLCSQSAFAIGSLGKPPRMSK